MGLTHDSAPLSTYLQATVAAPLM